MQDLIVQMMLATKLDAIFKIAASAPAPAAPKAAAAPSASGNQSDEIFKKLGANLSALSEDKRKEYAAKVKGSFQFNIKVSEILG